MLEIEIALVFVLFEKFRVLVLFVDNTFHILHDIIVVTRGNEIILRVQIIYPFVIHIVITVFSQLEPNSGIPFITFGTTGTGVTINKDT